MAAIDKTLNPTHVVPAVPVTDSTPIGTPVETPTGSSPAVAPNLRRFNQITGGATGAPRGIWSRSSAGYNGPIEVGNVRFASTSAALDQIVVENGVERNVPLLQHAFDAASA